jgi:hypothetical protein
MLIFSILDFHRGMNTDFWFGGILHDVQGKFAHSGSRNVVGKSMQNPQLLPRIKS